MAGEPPIIPNFGLFREYYEWRKEFEEQFKSSDQSSDQFVADWNTFVRKALSDRSKLNVEKRDSTVMRTAIEWRIELDAQINSTVKASAQQWRVIEKDLSETIDRLMKEIEEVRGTGVPVGVEWYRELEYYQKLQQQVYDQIGALTNATELKVLAEQAKAVHLGAQRGSDLLNAVAFGKYEFPKIPTWALDALIANLQEGTPLRNLLSPLGGIAVEQITNTLTSGLAHGKPISKIAQDITDAAGMGYARALLIARTEIIRAQQQATQMVYRDADSCMGFKRLADAANGCLGCVAKDGEMFAKKSEFYDHPNGRCTPVPLVAGVDVPIWQPAWERFETLPESEQRKRMGSEYFKHWQNGAFTIQQLGDRSTNIIWGDNVKTTPLSVLVPNWRASRGLPSRGTASTASASSTFAVKFEKIANDYYVSKSFYISEGHSKKLDSATKAVNKSLDKIGNFKAQGAPQVNYMVDNSKKRNINGYFAPKDNRVAIRGTRSVPAIRSTLYHEYGHYLDYNLEGHTDTFMSKQVTTDGRSVFKPFFDAFEKTDLYAELQKNITAYGYIPDFKKYYEYLLQPIEVWARSFAQFTAEAARDEAALKVILGNEGQYRGKDWDIMREAVKKVLQTLGALE